MVNRDATTPSNFKPFCVNIFNETFSVDNL